VEMRDLWGAQVPHGWVTGDDELGRHTWFRGELRARGERYVLGVPCTTTMRDLEAPLPAYQGRGRRPKAPWQAVRTWRQALNSDGWTSWMVRDGEKGPVEIAMVKRRVQTRLERRRTGPEEWLVVTRRPRSDDRILEGKSSPEARDTTVAIVTGITHASAGVRDGTAGATADRVSPGHQIRHVY
jgi:DDE superfamily endonuclease